MHVEKDGDSMIQCAYCKSKSFRRTTLEFKDQLKLVLLRYPVRCRHCGHRVTVSLFTAYKHAMPREAPHIGANLSWQQWTSGSDEDNPTVIAARKKNEE